MCGRACGCGCGCVGVCLQERPRVLRVMFGRQHIKRRDQAAGPPPPALPHATTTTRTPCPLTPLWTSVLCCALQARPTPPLTPAPPCHDGSPPPPPPRPQELKMQDGDVSYLTPEYRSVLENQDKIQQDFKVRAGGAAAAARPPPSPATGRARGSPARTDTEGTGRRTRQGVWWAGGVAAASPPPLGDAQRPARTPLSLFVLHPPPLLESPRASAYICTDSLTACGPCARAGEGPGAAAGQGARCLPAGPPPALHPTSLQPQPPCHAPLSPGPLNTLRPPTPPGPLAPEHPAPPSRRTSPSTLTTCAPSSRTCT